MPLVLNSSSISGLAAVGGLSSPQTGSVLQVVTGNTSTQVSSTTTTFIDTTLTATITPSSSSSKILILVNIHGIYNFANANLGHKFSIVRNSTNINLFCNFINYLGTAAALITSISSNYLDSPATTSATTYKVQFAKGDSTSGTASVQHNSDVSTITLMEIAA